MPAFKYSCFLSYRHGQRDIKQRFIKEFHEALSNELELFRNEEVYIDWERLKGGDFYNETLARALYQSVCMVAIYQPNYFDPEHTYCAREYRAMTDLEAERLALFPDAADRNHSLIIPIILRGDGGVPSEISRRRHLYDFSKFMLIDSQISKHPLYAPSIRQIAEYIHDMCLCFETAPVPFNRVDDFHLPSDDAIKHWLSTMTARRAAFPGRVPV